LPADRPPFQAASVPQTLRQVLDQEPVSSRQLNVEVPRDLETVCMKEVKHVAPTREYPEKSSPGSHRYTYSSGPRREWGGRSGPNVPCRFRPAPVCGIG